MNSDRVVSVTAMMIGLGSLFIIVYQTALLRDQQKAAALTSAGVVPQEL